MYVHYKHNLPMCEFMYVIFSFCFSIEIPIIIIQNPHSVVFDLRKNKENPYKSFIAITNNIKHAQYSTCNSS